jgi:hypothetical protein
MSDMNIDTRLGIGKRHKYRAMAEINLDEQQLAGMFIHLYH